MDLAFREEDLAFRDEVRAFIDEHFVQDLRERLGKTLTGYMDKDSLVRWHKALYRKGWIAPNWPVEYGGTGWDITKRYIFDNEMAQAGTPSLLSFGLRMCGPVLIAFGTQEQKDRFLPGILSMDEWWCQGYSEPGSGSDLASLQMKAVSDGDDYIVNGSKIWTTQAQHADWIFCLVRTGGGEKKQEGISFLLIDMQSPGIAVEPIILLDGSPPGMHEVNQVFFEDVRVPKANRVGEEGKGWTIAKYLLEFERGGGAASGRLKGALRKVRNIAKQEVAAGEPLLQDPAFQSKLALLETEVTALEFTELRILSALSTGQRPGAESSLMKCRATDLQQAISELAMEAVAYYAAPMDREVLMFGSNKPPVGPDYAAPLAGRYFNQRKTSIYGGSNEIQRNIMAKAILGL